MARERPIGIDLGTTFSAVACLDETGRSAMLQNAEGDLLTPSVVLFDDAEIVVGKEALNAAVFHPDWVAQWVKRDMGSRAYRRPIRGKYLPPEVIQACILRKLKADVVGALGPEARVVITVPAYFDEPRRKATADAGEMAGLRVLDIVNEPTAAALAFGEMLGYLSPSGEAKEEMTVLVYDLGGGTFDVTLLRVVPGDIRTIATDGDVQLGGHDWDLRLVDFAADALENSQQLVLRRDLVGMSRLLTAAIDAKHTLSARNRASIRVEHAGRVGELEVTRERFEELCGDLLERTAYTTRQLLADAGLHWKDVSRLLLVGGSTRMPMVGEMLRRLTGMQPCRTVNPDEAVARGAALYAGYLLAKQGSGAAGATFEVTNVNAHSLGVEGIDRETLRKTNVVLIRRNTPLPAKFTERFITKSEDQRSIVIQVLEGESSLPGECTPIGRTVIRGLPSGLPKGWPIEVTFEYGANGRLGVRAAVPGTQQDASLDLERAVGLSHEKIDRWKQPVTSSAGFDAFEAAVLDVLEESEPHAGPASGRCLSFGSVSGVRDQPPPLEEIPGGDAAPSSDRADVPRGPSSDGCAEPQVSGIDQPGTDRAPLRRSGCRSEASVALVVPPASKPRRRVAFVVGYLSSAIVGLGLGWLVLWLLSRWRPDVFSLPW
jgi:molecular chaperone DnaK